MFPQHYTEQRLVLVALCFFPYVALAIKARSFLLWGRQLFQSLFSLIVFLATFMSLWLSLSDFYGIFRGIWSARQAMTHSFYVTCFAFHGLVILIVLTTLNTALRPQFPFSTLTAAVVALFHILFLYNVLIVLFL